MRSVDGSSARHNQTVSRPLTNSALERLGKRLVAEDRAEQAGIEELHALLSAYRPVLASVVDAVSSDVGVAPASRIKNTGTILEKLRRNGGHTLSSIQDLAGLRVVVDGGREKQDRVVSLIAASFSGAARPARIVDRRAKPVQGYRAVHVIVYPDAFPIEIQVRARPQHECAEWFERLGDQYGGASATASRRIREAKLLSKLWAGCSSWRTRSRSAKRQAPPRRSASLHCNYSTRCSPGWKRDSRDHEP